MKYVFFILLFVALTLNFAGCGKKQESLEQMQAPMSIESLAVSTTEGKTAQNIQSQAASPKSESISASVDKPRVIKLDSLPPAGPYKPTAVQIQTALKNAGLYEGKIDGKVGPMTKKAIKQFQENNSLKVDGKVGPQTWGVLSKYLNTVPLERESASR